MLVGYQKFSIEEKLIRAEARLKHYQTCQVCDPFGYFPCYGKMQETINYIDKLKEQLKEEAKEVTVIA